MKILWLSTGTLNCEPIIGSLESIRQPDWDVQVFNYFENPFMAVAIEEFNPDVVIYISVASGPHLPPLGTFLTLKAISKPKSKFIHICFDAACPDWHPLLEEYKKQSIFDITVNIDGNSDWPQRDNDITTVAPIDPRPYQNSQTKVNLCGFSGGWESPGRYELVSYLKNKGLITVRSPIESFFSYREYAMFMNQCRIVLNMPQSGGGAEQVKARVIETGLAGACLLEQKDSITSRWFTPGLDYIEYLDKEDAERKIENLNRNPQIAKLCATLLNDKVMTKYSPKLFWDKIL